ncbi:hypothetical protein KC19_11G059700 [Ceratodon purpureus]|uniref:Uncharacterized protein n=1 Tax=Ceratodon purpureus TaxID=3225 RepID=A0A8T0GBK8_CERPU|nr:hypothetical protein KC19_11G059700 [Ceratodon purpureus]
MALLNLRALGASSLQPVAVAAPLTRCQARASSSTISDVVTTKTRKICGTQHLSCGSSFLSSRSRDFVRLQRLHALSLQMVTADHDSSGEQEISAEPSTESAVEATDSSLGLQGNEHLKQMLVDSLQGFQEGLKDLRDRGVLESAKLGYQDAQEKVKNLDAKQLITDLKSSSLSAHGSRWWRTSDPWIKWPLAIFVPFFLLVTLIFGMSVSQDLLPLWILGPLSTGLIIRQCCRAAELSRVVAEKTASQRAQLSATTLALYKDAKDGTLPEKTKLLVGSKLAELEETVSTKRSEITVYVTSGQAAAGAKDFSMNKLNELGEHIVEAYADYMEWWRPKGRALSRFLKKIF